LEKRRHQTHFIRTKQCLYKNTKVINLIERPIKEITVHQGARLDAVVHPVCSIFILREWKDKTDPGIRIRQGRAATVRGRSNL
jgi:hypothetical protein